MTATDGTTRVVKAAEQNRVLFSGLLTAPPGGSVANPGRKHARDAKFDSVRVLFHPRGMR